MSRSSEIFLGVIAVSTLLIAIVQIGVVLAAGVALRRLGRLVDTLEQEIKPIFGHVNTITRDASRAAALATAQVERADKLFSDVAVRVDEALNAMQASLGAPAREGRALFNAIRAAFQAIRELRQNGRSRQARGEEEDALFI